MINREADLAIDEDHWLKQFEKNLEKSAVQSRKVDQSLFDQINGIMNNKSKYNSVSAAVEDMMQRSGLTGYLNNINKISQEEINNSKKASHHKNHSEKKSKKDDLKHHKKNLMPIIFEKVPAILQTLKTYIKDTKGYLPIPAILEKIKSIHKKDISDDSHWDDPKLLRFISAINLQEKAIHSNNDNNHFNLGMRDTSIDANDSNTDAFNILMPAKL